MKKSLVMVSLVAASTSMMAMDLQYFLGAGAGVSWNKYEYNGKVTGPIVNETLENSESIRAGLLILKGGIILDNSHRLSINYAPAFHSDANVHNIFAGYDYLIPVNNESRFYVGAHLGHASFKGKEDIEGLDMSGLAYGTQIGYIYDITKNIEFELGLSYTKYNIDKEISYTESGHNIRENIELENSISTFAGINYKF